MRITIAAVGFLLTALHAGPTHAGKTVASPRNVPVTTTVAQQRTITRDYMVGEWVTRNIEFGKDVEIAWTVRADGTLAYRFTVDGNTADGSSGTWSIENDVVTERWQRPFGLTGIGTARIEAIDQSTMRLTIIDNGHPEYAGMVRVYRRRGGPQMSMLPGR